MLLEQVFLQESGADEVLGERKPLLGMAHDGVTYLCDNIQFFKKGKELGSLGYNDWFT